jgi:AraC-like DNA-binding protein
MRFEPDSNMPIIDLLVPESGQLSSGTSARDMATMLPTEWFLPTVHSVYFQVFSHLLSLPLSCVQRDSLNQPRLLPLLDYLPILDATHARDRPHGGRYLGLQIPMAAHGAMGAAAMVSQSIAHAMETMARFAHIRNRMFDFEYRRDQDRVSLLMRPRIPCHDYGLFIQNVTVFGKFGLLRAMVSPSDLQHGRLLLPWAEPDANSRCPVDDGIACVYQSPALGFDFPTSLADQPSALSDPGLYRHICQAGEEELQKLTGSLSAQVRHFLHVHQPVWPSLEELAACLSMSRRTLLRKLEAEQISYQQLLDEARNELACWYLRQSRMPLGQVAERIGFSDQTNFSRSFKRCKGLTPKDYRKRFVADVSVISSA